MQICLEVFRGMPKVVSHGTNLTSNVPLWLQPAEAYCILPASREAVVAQIAISVQRRDGSRWLT